MSFWPVKVEFSAQNSLVSESLPDLQAFLLVGKVKRASLTHRIGVDRSNVQVISPITTIMFAILHDVTIGARTVGFI